MMQDFQRVIMAGPTPASPWEMAEMAEDLHMNLLYLENRVAFARLLFPAEVKLAMDSAHAETTSEFAGLSASKGSCGNLREVDLNEPPPMLKRLISRKEALEKIEEMFSRHFPYSSQVLDNYMEDDLHDLYHLEKDTPEEQGTKTARFKELKDEVQIAFNKDREFCRSGLSSSSSSSSSLKDGSNSKIRKK